MQTITYRFHVTATMQLTTDGNSANFATEAGATDPKEQRMLERELNHALALLGKRLGMQFSGELLDYSIDGDDPHGPSCLCETCQMERAADTAAEGL